MSTTSSTKRPGVQLLINGSPLPQDPSPRSQPSPPRPSSSSQTSAASLAENRNNLQGGSSPAWDFTYEKFEYNLVVYTYKDVSVLVQAAPTYEEAIDIVLKEFPKIREVPREDISISYETTSQGESSFWRISESAWVNCAKKFQPRTRLEIGVRGQNRFASMSRKSEKNLLSYRPADHEKGRPRSLSPRPTSFKGRPGQPLTKQRSGNSISSFFKRF